MNALVILLPAALAALTWRFSSTDGLRVGWLRGLLAFGFLVTFLAETLGLFDALTRGPLAAAWALVIAAALWGSPRPKVSGLRPQSWIEGICLAGIAVVVALVGLTAVVSPTNSADAMAYHLPRVLFWVQQQNVDFFATHYLNQIMLQPLAEYFVLHSWLLSGGDRWANLVQFLGMLGCVAGVSLLARELGAPRRGQYLAALFCATLPNGILQASGAKNDYLLALWLVALAFFALRARESGGLGDAVAAGLALGLALATKGTAYVFAPPLLAGLLIAGTREQRLRMLRMAPVAAMLALLPNLPQYARNIDLSGSPLGFDSAFGDGSFRWQNEKFGVKPTISNALRHFSGQLGARSETWNQAVYQTVVDLHGMIGIDPSDEATTWRWSEFGPPKNSNHESDAHNRWHLLFLLAAAIPLAWMVRERRRSTLVWFYLALGLGFLLFCFYLKWQPFQQRMFLPLFVLGSAVAGVLLGAVRPRLLALGACLFLIDGSRRYLTENWARPLEGPNSIFSRSRDEGYLAELGQWGNQESFRKAVKETLRHDCRFIGVDSSVFQVEYPYEAMVLERRPDTRFLHVGVENPSAKYGVSDGPRPCAVICLECLKRPEKREAYRWAGEAVVVDRFLWFSGR